jgi:hypothetical protein
LSVAEPLGVTRLNADAGNGIAYLLLSRNALCLCFNARFAGGADPPDGFVCACAPIGNESVIATMSAVRISAPLFCFED